MYRFDIVFFNYKKIHCFIENFDKIKNFNPNLDRITCVTASPSEDEKKQFEDFCLNYSVKYSRYLKRKNRGLAELARLDFLSGKVGGGRFDSLYTFQMQEHYLAINDPCSKWGREFDYRVKGDVVPDGVYFDLDKIEQLFKENNLTALYADRNNPYRFYIDKKCFIAPNGGNFIITTDKIIPFKNTFIKLRNTCDNTYSWALFMEYFWGELFFDEHSKCYDLKNKIIVNDYSNQEKVLFYIGTEDYYALRNAYLCPHIFLKEPEKTNIALRVIKKLHQYSRIYFLRRFFLH